MLLIPQVKNNGSFEHPKHCFKIIFLLCTLNYSPGYTFTFIILFAVRGSRPGKNVQLTESEIRGLCLKSRELFLSQPILLELEAPLKICGKLITLKCLLLFIFSSPEPKAQCELL